MDQPEIAPPQELGKLMRPVGKDIPISARYGAKGPWWDWHYDAASGLWKQGVLCTECHGLFHIRDSSSVCVCGKRNGLGQHKGIDFAAPVGTMVFAMVCGIVEGAGWENELNQKQGFGLRVRQSFVVGTQLWKCWYGHLSEVSAKPGQRIAQGDVIGLSGRTGHAEGAHLHVEVRDASNQQVAFQFQEEAKNL